MMRLRRGDCRGQALAELAIFGGIMLIALAGLVRIGLRYNYAQQASQEAFRRALKSAHDNRPSSHGAVQVFHDRYIPDPSRPFAIGQTSLFSGAAAVTWGNAMQVSQVDLEREIPQQEIRINADSKIHGTRAKPAGSRFYATGQFLAWVAAPQRQFRRLARIFCSSDADSDEELEACAHQLRRDRRRIVNGIITLNRRHGFLEVPVIGAAGVTARRSTIIVLDSCAGQVNDPDICRRQCIKLKCGPNANLPDEIRACLAANLNVLPQPGYCAPLLDPDQLERRKNDPHGLDSTDYVRKVNFDSTVTGTTSRQELTVTQRESIEAGAGGIPGRVIRTQKQDGTFDEEIERVPYANPNRNRTRVWTTP